MNAEEIFHRALEITDPSGREAFLAKACAGNRDLRAEVQTLVDAHEQAGDFLKSLPVGAGVTLDNPGKIDGPGTTIGRYTLLELLGEGGMGLVYLAEQKEPVRRKVAFKIIKPGMDSRQVVARFEAERQALAVLDHPNIAHVFDAGCTDTGRPYFVMEHVKGMSITRYCDEHKLTIEQRLRLFEQVCEGVQHAHQKGIIHRDLKPSNVLVTVQGDKPVPKIIDFGIAKATTQSLTNATMFTCQGQFLGTPEYMSPEQADLATQDIDTRSDIYSLGVVLYELLAGVLPFESESFTRLGLAEIQRTIREIEPASPSARLTQIGDKARVIAESRGTQVVPLARRLHRELEWIPLKAMRKDRCRRYKSASDMADDIRNYLNGNPLLAGPETTVYRVQKFVRRHAGSVATVALVAVAIVLGLVVSTAMYFRAESMRVQAEQAKQRETAARSQAELAREEETVARTQAEKAEQATRQKAEELRRTLYANSIQLADAKYREANIRRVRELLASCPNDLRGWEWDRLNHIADQSMMTLRGHCGSDYEATNSIAVSPDGKRVVSAGPDDTIKIWDAAKGTEVMVIQEANDVIWATRPDGTRVPVSHDVTCVAFSPDGTRIASGCSYGTVKVWNTVNGREMLTIKDSNSSIDCIAFSPDGKHVVAASQRDDRVKVWNVETGNAAAALPGHKACVSVAYSPDGTRIITGEYSGAIRVWDAMNATQCLTLSQRRTQSVSFSPDGRYIVASGESEVKVWDVGTAAMVMSLRGHEGPTLSARFSPDGKYIASGSEDNTIRVWAVATGENALTLRGHDNSVSSVAFTSDGKRIVSASWDETVKIWDAAADREIMKISAHTGRVYAMKFSIDDKRIFSSDGTGARVWDVATGSDVTDYAKARRYIAMAASFSPDGKRIALCAGRATTLTVRDTEVGAEKWTVRADENTFWSATFSPDGKRLASHSHPSVHTITVFDVETGEKVLTIGGSQDYFTCIAFSPDGTHIVSGAATGKIKIWDASSGNEHMVLRGHEDIVRDVTFSSDGQRIASTSNDGTIRVWDTVTGNELMTLHGHASELVDSVAFSPDGRRIVSSGTDRTARVWDTTTRAELLVLRVESGVGGARFSHDGKMIAATTSEGSILLWESSPPAEGYDLRKHPMAAQALVADLYQKHGYYYKVIEKLQADEALDDSVRQLGMQIARPHLHEDIINLTMGSWEVIRSGNNDAESYRVAFERAVKAKELSPNASPLLLGAAQYRVGAYKNALENLAKAAAMRSTGGGENDPSTLAFVAMTLQKLDRHEEAQAALKQLRELCSEERLAKNVGIQALLAEAEGLIEGGKK